MQQNGQEDDPSWRRKRKNKQAGPGQEKLEGAEIKDRGGGKQEARKIRRLSKSRTEARGGKEEESSKTGWKDGEKIEREK